MSIDYGERERQFIETLKTDTGRGLDEWLAAIAAERLTHRNDIIDWLRRQGFMFSKASWIERIHNNGGRPIYAGTAGTPSRARPERRPRLAVVSAPPQPRPAFLMPPASPPMASQPPATPPPAVPPPPAPPSRVSTETDAERAAIDAQMARAKAYRPLAAYLLSEIRKLVPDTAVLPRDGSLVFRLGETDFAVLALSAKELRLGLVLKSSPAGTTLEPAKLPGLRGAPVATHMAILTDARQVTPSLLAAVAQAAAAT